MKQILTLLIGFFVLFSCNNVKNENSDAVKNTEIKEKKDSIFGIVIHGGAGTILRKKYDRFFRKRISF